MGNLYLKIYISNRGFPMAASTAKTAEETLIKVRVED